jgi:hypothetical protein
VGDLSISTAPAVPILTDPAASPPPARSPVPNPLVPATLPVTGIPVPTLTTVRAPGGAAFRVATSAAPQFQGLVNDLEAAGYLLNPKTSGGFNDRFIDGTKIPSQHAWGRAVDVNWDKNPNGAGGESDIPASLANALAQKYGLTWGGNWAGASRDPMHFEVPAAGPGVGKLSPSAQPTTAPSPPPIAASSDQSLVPSQPTADPPPPDPTRALALLRLLTPPTHALRAVDYDPWKIQRLGETGPGAGGAG